MISSFVFPLYLRGITSDSHFVQFGALSVAPLASWLMPLTRIIGFRSWSRVFNGLLRGSNRSLWNPSSYCNCQIYPSPDLNGFSIKPSARLQLDLISKKFLQLLGPPYDLRTSQDQMDRLASMREQMKRKREEIEAEPSDTTPEGPAQKQPKRSEGSMFKYIPKELHCKALAAANISLVSLPPAPPNPPPPVTPARIPVAIYHDGAAPHTFKNNTTKNRVGRVVFLSSKTYKGRQMPYLSGEFGEKAAEKEVIFACEYATATH